MSIADLPQTFTSVLSPPPPPTRKAVVIVEDKVSIPAWVDDRESFRRWVHSDDYPKSGWISYLQGELWVDMTMEKFLTHNQVKFAIYAGFAFLLQKTPLGRFVPDRMLLSNEMADITTEPDGLFFLWETLKSGRIRFLDVENADTVELSGTPDMVLEVVSKTSVRKDTVRLREPYWQAGIPEYWLVDARGQLNFEILRHTPQGYEATPALDGWVASTVVGQSFRLTQSIDSAGCPQYTLEMRAS